jgi:hypothetical protein
MTNRAITSLPIFPLLFATHKTKMNFSGVLCKRVLAPVSSLLSIQRRMVFQCQLFYIQQQKQALSTTSTLPPFLLSTMIPPMEPNVFESATVDTLNNNTPGVPPSPHSPEQVSHLLSIELEAASLFPPPWKFFFQLSILCMIRL